MNRHGLRDRIVRHAWARGLFLFVPMVASSSAVADDGTEFFESRIRPVLVEHCYSCHGSEKQSSGLRVDSLQGMLAGGSGEGAALVPGKPDESPLVQALKHEEDGLKMPPKAKLADDQIADIAAWVRMGAHWPKGEAVEAEAWRSHWAFQPIRAAAVPTVVGDDGPIDAFVRAKLSDAGLKLSHPTDRRTLLRRLSFDLIGLPPTADEVTIFENDSAPDAYARQVERLLNSPHYGERWGRHWLDVARYADTKGYVFQEERRYPYAYTYRDYVVDAFNRDKPYDQFLVEQLAADRLPDADPKTLAAMGFLTVGRRFLNNNDDIIDDRIDVVTRGLLGLTVACARCHDHKYDPVPTDDYYSLYGVFASSAEPGELPLIGEAPAGPEAEEYQTKRAERQRTADAYIEQVHGIYRHELVDKLGGYLQASVALGFEVSRDANKLDNAARGASVRPELLRWVTPRWKGTFERHPQVFAAWKSFAALASEDFPAKASEVVAGMDSATQPRLTAILTANPPTNLADVANAYGLVLRQARDHDNLGPPVDEFPERSAWLAVLDDPQGPDGVLLEETRRLLNRAERDKLQGLVRKVAELESTHPGAPPRAMVMNDKPDLVNPQVFLRGNPGRRGKSVPRQFLRLIDGEQRTSYAKSSGRLEMAQSIVRPDNPLTARVMVNRIWMHHMGSALVGTPSDFGLRSDAPTHPELLDYLARSFIDSGWSIKAMHRQICLSKTYQQASNDDPDARAVDPENRLLWRANRRRLDFESLRDAILAASAKLDGRLGGRPEPLFDKTFSNRRTLYGFIDRQNLDGIYRAFDFASPDATTPKRYATTVPQQALFLMNSPFVVEQAKALASRPDVVAEADPDARIRAIYRGVFARNAGPDETSQGRRFVDTYEAADGKLSAWEAYSQVLLLTNELMFVD